jgi:hypothetical protein
MGMAIAIQLTVGYGPDRADGNHEDGHDRDTGNKCLLWHGLSLL